MVLFIFKIFLNIPKWLKFCTRLDTFWASITDRFNVDVSVKTKLPKDANEDEHQSGTNRFVAHFNAHFEPIVALNFDPSGMLLVSADKRGHRFHVFRINPHPCGPTLAYVQHLYTLHRWVRAASCTFQNLSETVVSKRCSKIFTWLLNVKDKSLGPYSFLLIL